MTDDEFDLLDELYFVQSYNEVKDAVNWDDEKLTSTLNSLHQEGFIRILQSHDEEFKMIDSDKAITPWEDLFYLATKKGLLQHNGF